MINKNLKKRFYTTITLLILTLLIIKYNTAFLSYMYLRQWLLDFKNLKN